MNPTLPLSIDLSFSRSECKAFKGIFVESSASPISSKTTTGMTLKN